MKAMEEFGNGREKNNEVAEPRDLVEKAQNNVEQLQQRMNKS